MEVTILKIRFCGSVGVVRQLNIDDCIITMRKNQIGVLSRTMVRSHGEVIDNNMLV